MTTFISSLFHAVLFRKYNFVVSQLKHLKSKTTSLFFGALYVIYQLSEIKDDIQVVPQFPCLLGHPV